MRQIPFSVVSLHKTCVSGLLDGIVRIGPSGNQRRKGTYLIRPFHVPAAKHRLLMAHACSSFCAEQIVPAVSLIQMRAFCGPGRCAGKNPHRLADQPLFLFRVFLKDDSGKADFPGTEIREHIDKPFPPVIIMEKRWIETAGIHINRIRPGTLDIFCRHQIIIYVIKNAGAFHIRVDQIEFPIMIGQTGSPDTFGGSLPGHI